MEERINVQVMVFCRTPEFSVLVLKRTPERSGYWQPVCGGVEKGETPRAAALREIEEETGIKDVKEIFDLDYTFTYREPKRGVLMDMRDICFAAEVEGAVDISLSEEHEEYKWCSYDESKKYLTWEPNCIALDKLTRKIGL